MLSPRLAPFADIALNRLRPRQRRVDHAARIEVLQEAEVEPVEPPVALAGQAERATAADPHSTLDQQRAVLAAREIRHAPVLRYVFENAVASRSGFAAGTYAERHGRRIFADMGRRAVRVERLEYCFNPVIGRYFGHWLIDGVPMARLGGEGVDGAAPLWLPHDPAWPHAALYEEYFGLAPLRDPLVIASELVCYQDHGQGSHKRARYAALRGALRARFAGGDSGTGPGPVTDPGARPDGPRRIYLRRGATGARRVIESEAAFEAALAAEGFSVVDIAATPLPQVLEALASADIVVGMEGSHLNHAHMMLAPGSVLLILVPADRFTLVHVGRARAMRTVPAFVVIEGTAAAGYRVRPAEVLATLAAAEARRDRAGP